MKAWIKSHPRIFKLIIWTIGIVAVCAWLYNCSGAFEVPVQEYNKPLPLPKIMEVRKPYVKPEVVPNVPVKKKKVYTVKDITLRKQAEKKDIILDVKIVNGGIELTKIGTDSTVSTDFIPAPITLEDGAKELVIVPEGVEVKKRKKLRAWVDRAVKNGKTVLIIVGGVTVIVLVAVVAGG